MGWKVGQGVWLVLLREPQDFPRWTVWGRWRVASADAERVHVVQGQAYAFDPGNAVLSAEMHAFVPAVQVFATREAAEADCKRRNGWEEQEGPSRD